MYKIGIIGAGMIAEKHADSFLKTGRAVVEWVARQDQSRLAAFQQKYGVPHGTTDYREMLADPSMDAVVITAPPAMHFEMFKAVMASGKHLLIEKPLGITPEEISAMVKLRQQHPEIKVCDCSCRHSRLQPKYKVVKDIIRSGRLGDIYYIHHNSVAMQSRPGIEYHPDAKWFINKAIAGGGPLIDWGVYDLSFHLGLLDDQPRLKNLSKFFIQDHLDQKDPGTNIYNVEEHFAVKMNFDTGLTYYWERAAHANMEAPNETRIYGTKGGVKLSYCTWDSNVVEIFSVDQDGKGVPVREQLEVDVSHQVDEYELARHFIEVLDGSAEPAMPLDLAAKHLDIIQRIYNQHS